MKSTEYQHRLEQEEQIQKNTDSIRANWLVYLNAELIVKALRQIAEKGRP